MLSFENTLPALGVFTASEYTEDTYSSETSIATQLFSSPILIRKKVFFVGLGFFCITDLFLKTDMHKNII